MWNVLPVGGGYVSAGVLFAAASPRLCLQELCVRLQLMLGDADTPVSTLSLLVYLFLATLGDEVVVVITLSPNLKPCVQTEHEANVWHANLNPVVSVVASTRSSDSESDSVLSFITWIMNNTI